MFGFWQCLQFRYLFTFMCVCVWHVCTRSCVRAYVCHNTCVEVLGCPQASVFTSCVSCSPLCCVLQASLSLNFWGLSCLHHPLQPERCWDYNHAPLCSAFTWESKIRLLNLHDKCYHPCAVSCLWFLMECLQKITQATFVNKELMSQRDFASQLYCDCRP